MRPIYWGIVLTIAGFCSYVILILVAFRFFVKSLDGFSIVSMPLVLYVAIFAMLFSLPVSIVIEIYGKLRNRKERKGRK